MEFKLHAPFKPTGDQPQAIEKLARGVELDAVYFLRGEEAETE